MPEMIYPTPNATNFVELLAYTQSIVPFAQLSTIAVFFVAFLALKRYETTSALPPALFLTFLTALFFHLLGLLEDFWVIGTAVFLALSVVIIYFRHD